MPGAWQANVLQSSYYICSPQCLKAGSHYVTQSSQERLNLLPLPPDCWIIGTGQNAPFFKLPNKQVIWPPHILKETYFYSPELYRLFFFGGGSYFYRKIYFILSNIFSMLAVQATFLFLLESRSLAAVSAQQPNLPGSVFQGVFSTSVPEKGCHHLSFMFLTPSIICFSDIQ